MKNLSKSNLLNHRFESYNADLKSTHFATVLLFNTEERKKRIMDSIGEYLEKFGGSYPHVALCHSTYSINEFKDKLLKDGGLLILDYDTWFEETSYEFMPGGFMMTENQGPNKIKYRHQKTLDELIASRNHSNIKIIVYSSNHQLHKTLQYHSLILKPEDFYSAYIDKGHHVLAYN